MSSPNAEKEKKDNLSTLLFLVCALTVLFTYGGITIFSPYEPFSIGLICILLSSTVGFFAVCGLTVYSRADQNSFSIGFCYGFVAHILSFFMGFYCLQFITGNNSAIGNMLNWALALVLGSAIWGLAAIPTCALFRRLFARLKKE